jgi:hypothetical protein
LLRVFISFFRGARRTNKGRERLDDLTIRGSRSGSGIFVSVIVLMWMETFKKIRADGQTLEGRFIDGKIAFRGSAGKFDATANADAALSVLAHRAGQPVEIAFVHPDATPAKARQVLLAIAFAELMRNSSGRVNSGPSGILYVTQQIVDARQNLAEVRVKNENIGDVFRIGSPNSSPILDWRNLIVANPGRVLQGFPNAGRMQAIVIDASHPRTLIHLPDILRHTEFRQIPLRIIIAPPHESLLDKADDRLIWLWDPKIITDVWRLLTSATHMATDCASRTYWTAPHIALDGHFAAAEKRLYEAMRISVGRVPEEVIEAWYVLSAERGLCVPLEQAERAWRNSRNGARLRDRLDLLRKAYPPAQGELKGFLAMHWAGILENLEQAYTILKTESVPSKFLTMIDTLDEFTHRPDLPLRIVTASEEEAPLLAANLADLDSCLRTAIDSGTLEIVHQREDARRVAVGNRRTTILAGARTSRHRYLDLFPSNPVHVIAYPYESARDRQWLGRSYDRWAPWANGYRQRIGTCLKLDVLSPAQTPHWIPPPVVIRGAVTLAASQVIETPTPELEIAWLGDEGTIREHNARVCDFVEGSNAGRTRIVNVDGIAIELSNRRTVDIYRPETDVLLRVPPDKVSRGDYLVTLLDDPYESLFDRLCELASLRRPTVQTLHLERWKLAKSRVFHAHHGNRKAIQRALGDRISVDYAALKEWFGAERDEDGECIGPREKADFEQLAALSGVYKNTSDTDATFRSIELERYNHRRLGRQLCGAVRALARRHSSDRALRTAATLDAEVEEVRDALELREVATVEPI